MNGSLTPLEHETAINQTEQHRTFVITPNAKVFLSIPNTGSPVRVAPDVHFVVKMLVGDADPTTLISLRKLTVGKKDREMVEATIKGSLVPFQGTKSERQRPDLVSFTVRKYGSGSFEIIPQQPLEPGEYAFVHAGRQADCFGVDVGAAPSGQTYAAVAPPAPPPPPPPTIVLPQIVKWDAKIQSPVTRDVKDACEARDPARQAYCFAIMQTFNEYNEAAGDSEGTVRSYCIPESATAATLRDAFLDETTKQPDQLLGPVGTFWGPTAEHHFRCPTVAKPKRAVPKKKTN